MFTISYPVYLAYQGGVYIKELAKVDHEREVKNNRSKHLFVEYDTRHPSAMFYLLAMCVKKAIFVGMAITLYNYYCFALGISAFLQFASLMFNAYVRPFRAGLHNAMIIAVDFVTLLCFVVLFRYANAVSV